MATAVEREHKYEGPDGFRVPDLAGVGGIESVGEADEHELDATYYDTGDLRLVRSGFALRRRTGGGDAGWHLKVGEGGTDRTEYRRTSAAPSPPRDLVRLARAAARGEPVEPVARVVTRRRERPLRGADGRVLAMLAEDAVVGHDLVDGGRTSWREIEVELVDGDDAVLSAVDRRMRSAGAREGREAKVRRVLGARLRGLADTDAAGAAGPVPVYLRAQRDALLLQDPAAREGDVDAVHDMRVAVRRLRTTLRTFRSRWDRAWVESVRGELKWLGEQLGGVRDAQVMARRLDKAVHAEPAELVLGPVAADIHRRFATEGTAALDALRRALTSARYTRLVADLDAVVERPPARDTDPRWVARRVRGAVRRADLALDAALALPGGEAGADADRDRSLHEARKAYKRARYAVEVRRPSAGKPAERLVRALKGLQDLLGDHQDSVITRAVLRRHALAAYGEGANTFTYGLLHGRQAAADRELTRTVSRAAGKARRRKLRRWL
jgi:CHAD domain-containing protein